MDRSLEPVWALMRLTLTDPMEGGRRAMALNLPRAVVWQAFALVVVLSVLLTEIASFFLPPAQSVFAWMSDNPIAAGLVQAVLLVIMVHAVHRIGAFFGGKGDFEQSLKIVVWLQIMLVALQIVQLVALLILPPLAPLIGLAAIIWFFWVLTSFIMVLHGFQNRFKVLVGIVASFFAVVFVLTILANLLGLPLTPGVLSDV